MVRVSSIANQLKWTSFGLGMLTLVILFFKCDFQKGKEKKELEDECIRMVNYTFGTIISIQQTFPSYSND